MQILFYQNSHLLKNMKNSIHFHKLLQALQKWNEILFILINFQVNKCSLEKQITYFCNFECETESHWNSYAKRQIWLNGALSPYDAINRQLHRLRWKRRKCVLWFATKNMVLSTLWEVTLGLRGWVKKNENGEGCMRASERALGCERDGQSTLTNALAAAALHVLTSRKWNPSMHWSTTAEGTRAPGVARGLYSEIHSTICSNVFASQFFFS